MSIKQSDVELFNFYERTLTSFWIQIWGFEDSTIWCMNTSRPRRIVDTIGKTPISQTNFQNPEFIQSIFHLKSKNDWEGQKKTENWKSITSAFSWLFFSFLPYRQRGNRRKLRKHLEKSRGNAMWWTKLQNSTKIHVMDWAIQNATRWWYPIMAVRKIKISQIFCNEKKIQMQFFI